MTGTVTVWDIKYLFNSFEKKRFIKVIKKNSTERASECFSAKFIRRQKKAEILQTAEHVEKTKRI